MKQNETKLDSAALLDGAESPSTSLLDDVRTLYDVLYAAPELNQSNYDPDDVCKLNAAMIEAYFLSRKLLSRVASNADLSGSEALRSDALLDAGNALAKEAAALIIAVRSDLARSTLHGRRGVVQILGDLSTLIDRWDDASNAKVEFSEGSE